MVVTHYYRLMEVWHGNESLRFMEIHRRWCKLKLTSKKSSSQTAEQLKRLVRDGFVVKEEKKYISNFDFERFNQSRMLQRLRKSNGETYFYNAALPALHSLDGMQMALEIMPWLEAKSSDETFVQSLLIRLTLRTFEMLRLLNFVKKLRALGINITMPEVLLNYSMHMTPFLDDYELYQNNPNDVFKQCWPEGNDLFKDKLDEAMQSNKNRHSIETILPYLRRLLPFNENELNKYANSHNILIQHRSSEKINHDLRIVEQMKRELDDTEDSDSYFEQVCTALVYDIIEKMKKGNFLGNLALTCTTHPNDNILSPQMQNIIESIKDERNLSIMMKLHFPDKLFIEKRLPILMSINNLKAEEVNALEIFLKNEVSFSKKEIKEVIQNYKKIKAKKEN